MSLYEVELVKKYVHRPPRGQSKLNDIDLESPNGYQCSFISYFVIWPVQSRRVLHEVSCFLKSCMCQKKTCPKTSQLLIVLKSPIRMIFKTNYECNFVPNSEGSCKSTNHYVYSMWKMHNALASYFIVMYILYVIMYLYIKVYTNLWCGSPWMWTYVNKSTLTTKDSPISPFPETATSSGSSPGKDSSLCGQGLGL